MTTSTNTQSTKTSFDVTPYVILRCARDDVRSGELPFNLLFQQLLKNINKLPPNELSYYLVLLMAALKKEKHSNKSLQILEKANNLTLALHQFYQKKTPASLDEAVRASEILAKTAQINTFSMKIKKIILALCSVITTLIGGMLGAIIGFGCGLFSELNFLNGAKSGFTVGLCMGLLIGSRVPDKLFRSRLECKLLFCFKRMKAVCRELNEAYQAGQLSQYQVDTKQYILDTFFQDASNKEIAFAQFLTSTQSFQVCTTPSQLIDRKLDGTLSHHALIRYRINGKTGIPIEFGDRKKTPRWVDQAESTRYVSGQKLFEMLILDRILEKTHPKNTRFALTTFQTGDNDCHTYVNKVLIGTQQKPTVVKRFAPEIDTWIGTHVVRRCVRFVSDTAEKELDVMSSFYQGAHPKLSFFNRPSHKKITQAIPDWSTEHDTNIQGPLIIQGDM